MYSYSEISEDELLLLLLELELVVLDLLVEVPDEEEHLQVVDDPLEDDDVGHVPEELDDVVTVELSQQQCTVVQENVSI